MDPQESVRDQYSAWMGLIYVFNLIVGTGALTLPAVFSQAGWALGLTLIIILAFISFITVTFVIESMACANAIVHWRRLRLLKKDRAFQDSSERLSDTSDESCAEETEGEPLFHSTCRYYELDRKLELGEMATLFFNRPGRILFYACFAIYLYGDLSIYSAAVAKSMADVTCTYVPANDTNSTLSPDMLCWEGSKLTRKEAYRMFLGGFLVTLGPFVFFNVQKTKYLQIFTSLMRWIAFSVMIGLATHRLIVFGPVGHPKLVSLSGVPALFGACVYSFMCHHSLPSLITPVRNKSHLKTFLSFDYILICAFYLLLAMTGTFAFAHLDDLYTLNFVPSASDHANFILKLIEYFLALFPVFTLSTSFPIIAITLKNNLQALFLDVNRIRHYNIWLRDVLFPLLAVVPPILVAFLTENLSILVGFTGSYAGNAIQYLIPTFLVFYARRTCFQLIGLGVKNEYRSPFRGVFWLIFVVVWSVACVILVTVNFCRGKTS